MRRFRIAGLITWLHCTGRHRNTGLRQLGKPEGYIQRQVEGWTKRYTTAQTDKIESLGKSGHVITKNQPATPSRHFFTMTTNTIILFWMQEISVNNRRPGLGDVNRRRPRMDLGASLAYWAEEGDGDLAKVFTSLCFREIYAKEVVLRYSEKSGRIIINPLFLLCLGLYKNAVIAQQIYARWKQGHSKRSKIGQLIQ